MEPIGAAASERQVGAIWWGMRLALLVLPVVTLALFAAHPDDARADRSSWMQYGLATEHAGLGVGREFGAGATTVVAGVGTGLAVGYSSVEGWIGAFAPGAGLGVRRHLRGFYAGPTLGVNYTLWASGARHQGYAEPWLMLDVGHRWDRAGHHDHSFKLGLAGGVALDDGAATPAVGLTLAWTR